MTCAIPIPLESVTSRQSTPGYFDDSMDVSYTVSAKNQGQYLNPYEQMPNSGYFFDARAVGGGQQQVALPSQNLPGYLIPGAPAMCNPFGKDQRQFRPVLQNTNFNYNTFAPAMLQADPSYVYQRQQQPVRDVSRHPNSHAFPINQGHVPSYHNPNLPQPPYSYAPIPSQNVYPAPLRSPWPYLSKEDTLRVIEAAIMIQAARLDIVMSSGRSSPQDIQNYLHAIQLRRTMAMNPHNYVSPTQQWNNPNQGFFYGNAPQQFPVPPPQFRWPVPRHLLQRPMCLSCLALARSKMRVREWLDSIDMLKLETVPDDDLNGYELEGEEDVEFSEADGSEDEEDEDSDSDADDDDGSEEDESEEDGNSENGFEHDSDEDTSDCSFKTRSERDSVRTVPSTDERKLMARP